MGLIGSVMSAIQDLRKTVAILRGPEGCPWDREQTHASLTACLLEECAELLDTIDREDREHMREELGDVLLQVVMHAQLAEEAGAFDLEDVARDINEKLIRRHPHVFGEASAKDTAAVLKHWEAVKQQEKAQKKATQKTLLPRPVARLSALQYAGEAVKQLKKHKIVINPVATVTGIDNGYAAMNQANVGRLLFDLVVQMREAGLDPEATLRNHTDVVLSHAENELSEKSQSPM